MMAESISNSLTETGSVVMAVDYSDNSEWAFDCKYMQTAIIYMYVVIITIQAINALFSNIGN
jgi:hypothetical protein